jgi:hypothetical protein
MTDDERNKAIKRAKRFNYTFFVIFALLFLALAAWGISGRYSHTFSAAKWTKSAQRVNLVSDLLNRGCLEGKTREEILLLLGEASIENSAGGKLAYYLPPASGLFDPSDGQWLVISLDDGVYSGGEISLRYE